jgi:hypothetical protein
MCWATMAVCEREWLFGLVWIEALPACPFFCCFLLELERVVLDKE